MTNGNTFLGTPNHDFIRGSLGNDRAFGLAGNDTIFGRAGNDRLFGQLGNDFLRGSSGSDFLSGGKDNDSLVGGNGNDRLRGGDGNDVLIGGGDFKLFGLTDQNSLVAFDPDRPDQSQTIHVTGVSGKLLGIDVRPANGLLYGITDTSKIYTINTTTGAATFVSTLSPITFDAGVQSGVDFNPVPDRLRLVGSNDQNLRVNVDTGAIADFDLNTPGFQPDRNLAYAANDPNFGVNPNITAAAYTNAFFGPPSPTGLTPATRTTQLFGIDFNRDVLVLQNPPNDGTLTTIGSLGIDFKPTGGFDIFSPADGVNIAVAATGSSLYTIDLSTGKATALGTIGNGTYNLIGLAAVALPGDDGADFLQGGRGNDILIGGTNFDILKGDSGDDVLNGGAGNDLLVGGDGSDRFLYDTGTTFAGAAIGVDTIADFTSSYDKIVLDKTTFAALQSIAGTGFSVATEFAVVGSDAAAATSAAFIVYSSATGNLFYNTNGTTAGYGTGDQFATLAGKPAISLNDFSLVV